MRRVETKPISVNQCWQGRRFKTPEYKAYEREVLKQLRPMAIPEGRLVVSLKFWFTNAAADVDNPVKPILDILQKAYGFNDSRIYKLEIEKSVLPVGRGYFEFDISALPQQQESRLSGREVPQQSEGSKAA